MLRVHHTLKRITMTGPASWLAAYGCLAISAPVGRWLQQVAMASVLSSRSTFQSVLIVGSRIHLAGNNRDQADMPLLVRYIDFDMKSQN